MRCPELAFGAAYYFTALAIAVGAVLRIGKRLLPDSQRTADLIPALAFVIGYGVDVALGMTLCDRTLLDAAVAGLAGGMAGLAAAGGHEAMVRSAHVVGLGAEAERLMGRASVEQEKRRR